MSDQELVERALAGDRPAQEKLFDQLLPVMQCNAASMLRRWRKGLAAGRDLRSEVEDMVQETWLHLFEQDGKVLRSWNPERLLEPFIAYITRIRTAGFLRSPRSPWREPPIAVEAIPERLEGRTPEEESTIKDLWERIYLCVMAKQKPKDILRFDLLFIRQYSPREVAERVKSSLDSIHQWQSRLRRSARLCRDAILVAA